MENEQANLIIQIYPQENLKINGVNRKIGEAYD